MIYSPDAKALVYNEIQFISVASPKGQTRVYVDLDRMYDDVFSEITSLYFGETVETERVLHLNTNITFAGAEISG